jgi:hypothetical protein
VADIMPIIFPSGIVVNIGECSGSSCEVVGASMISHNRVESCT